MTLLLWAAIVAAWLWTAAAWVQAAEHALAGAQGLLDG